MAFDGCEHCGFVRSGNEKLATKGAPRHCPDCGRPLDRIDAEEARELFRERLAARRYRQHAAVLARHIRESRGPRLGGPSRSG
jgi:hypothetical protein